MARRTPPPPPEDFTERNVDLGFWKGDIPTTWFLALNPLMIFVFTPILVKLWSVEQQMGGGLSTISKLALGFFCVESKSPEDEPSQTKESPDDHRLKQPPVAPTTGP